MRFVSIDVETANPDMASICSIGAATFENGQLSSEWYSLIDPEDYFDGMNISIHGITPEVVAGSANFFRVFPDLEKIIGNSVAVSHTHFDRVAIHQATRRWGMSAPTINWLDSARVARRTWAEVSRSGYGLSSLCKRIGYKFQHHNALEDAKAAGHILLAAMGETGLDLNGVLNRVKQPIDLTDANSRKSIARTGNPAGPFYGEIVVFTGSLEIPRHQAAELAANLGCEVAQSVTKKTTLLVVGDMDVSRLGGRDKSSKHRKAEELISKGYQIQIVRETDFKEMAGNE